MRHLSEEERQSKTTDCEAWFRLEWGSLHRFIYAMGDFKEPGEIL
jgi:hypothetical protein